VSNARIAEHLQSIDLLRADAARLIRDLSTAPTATPWQPIETAPKDGTPVMVWPPTFHGLVSCAAWIDDESNPYTENKRWVRHDARNQIQKGIHITHWAPIPAGPEVTP
jgi:hypothetical protein